ncbi:MAG TPA: hypothetical protein DDZ88_27625 [Verrucomicrobiales bacterium]|nr:hypothetical protein [Verrucomicrobiales bacterium]
MRARELIRSCFLKNLLNVSTELYAQTLARREFLVWRQMKACAFKALFLLVMDLNLIQPN